MSIFTAAVLVIGAQDEIFSGPQPGEKTPGFTVFDIGSRREVDYVAEWKGAPTLLIFVHELTRPGAALMRPLDEYAQVKKVRGLRALVVSLAEDRDEAERRLPMVKGAIQLKTPWGVSVDGPEGPGAYGLNREVTLTILVAKDNRVHANFAILSPNETDAPGIRKAIDEVLKREPEAVTGTPEELAAEVARLREENLRLREELAGASLRAERAETQVERMNARRGGRAMRRPEGGGEAREPEDERLVGLCRGLIQKEASEEDVAAAVKRIEEYIHGKDGLRGQYVAILGRILRAGYGTDHAKDVMKEQLAKHRR